MQVWVVYWYCTGILILVISKTHLIDTFATDEHGTKVARVSSPKQPKLAVHASLGCLVVLYWYWYCTGILILQDTHLVDTLSTDEHGAEIARVSSPEQPKLAVHASLGCLLVLYCRIDTGTGTGTGNGTVLVF